MKLCTVRTAIIGIGNIGHSHAENIYNKKIAGMSLSAVCDIDTEKLGRFSLKYPEIPVFTDWTELLQSHIADAIIIAVPHFLHPIIATAAFENGYHVLTEKPAGVYTKAVKQMNEAAEKSGKVFGIMFNQRTNPLYAKVHDIVQNNLLGKPKRLTWIITNWYRTQSYYNSGTWRATWRGEGGGVLLNQAPHNLDLMQWIFGMPEKIRAFCSVGKYHNIEVEDDATIYAEYNNGATAVFITSTGEYPGTNRLEIVGDKGKIVLENQILKWWKLSESERDVCFNSTNGMPQIPCTYEEIKQETPESAHCGILQNFANAILYGEPLIASGYDGINQLTISNAAFLSSWKNDWVSLPIDDNAYETALNEHIISSEIKELNKSANKSDKSDNIDERWKVRW